MNELTFYDEQHEQFFYKQVEKQHVKFSDVERISLFYLLGLMPETRQHFKKIYDVKCKGINLDAPTLAFQTSGTRAITKIGFILFNDYREPYDFAEGIMVSPNLLTIFCSVDLEYVPFMYQAISLRLGLLRP